MTSQALKFADKIKFFNSVLSTKAHQDAVDAAIKEADGDMANALKSLKTKLPAASLRKVDLAYQLEDWSGQNIPIVQALVKNAEIDSLRDIALNYNVKKLADIVDSKHLPEDTAGKTASEKKKNFAVALHHKLFTTETSAVLQRMVQDAEIPVLDQTVGAGVAKFFENQPDFNIRTTSIYTALKHTKAFAGISEEHQAEVVEELKKLQRVQSLSPVSEAIPVLIQANLTSAFGVAEMPESSFIRAHGKALGQETARQVYTNAINNRIRNEQALMTMRESVRGTGLAIIDGDRSMEDRRAMMLQAFADKTEVPDNVNWEKLFGDMDVCECEECTSVYSPASYFVELLQYLRNNNLGPDPASENPNPSENTNIHPGIKGTPLEKMFRRRPDLGCLELTCDNTFTVLPYIDLVNEVMESFVVHLEDYEKSPKPKQARLDTFNVEDETTSELLAQPQHTNYQAYCILKSAVYPFTLPYHQPIDATRIFLKYLGTSRYELLNTYRAVDEACANNSFTSEGQNELKKLHQQTLDRAVDAEFLGMTQEEYIILTKEAFWPKGYFDIALGKNHTKEEYQEKIGVKPVHEYYGYETKDAMLDIDETNQLGLTFVKKRFLPLTGIQYIDLVEILKTQFINPNHPQGDDLKILESIRFSYRFLQTLVDTNSNNPSIRFAKLVAFLETAQFFVPLLDAYLHPDPCQKQKPGWHLEIRDLRKWVYCYFERIGELIVLEAGEGPSLPIEGKVYTKLLQEASEPVFVGTLRKDGLIVDENEEFIGSITIDSQVIRVDGQLFISQFEEGTQLEVRDSESNPIGHINQSSILVSKDSETTVNWSPAQDTCDLDKVRLVHLDGTALSNNEYDRFQRFIRLWRKLGWTINEVDKALVGLSVPKDSREGATASDDCEYIGFEIFNDNCTSSSGGFINDCNNSESEDSCDDVEQWANCVERNDSISEITPDLLNQIVAVRKLLDLSGLSLIQLLAFWSNISTVGEKSLYARLFLTHNLLGIDKVFKVDRNGAYLTKSAKISDHLPVLMAALRLKSDDIMNMMDEKFFTKPLNDLLSLKNVSIIYRYSVLAKILHLRIEELDGAIELFGEPFKSAQETLSFMEKWGKIEDAGLEFRQVNYIIKGVDDKLRPIAPNKRTILQLTKTLYDGLNGIDREHKDIFIPESPDEKKNLIAEEEKKIEATTELVRSKIGLLFEPVVVEKIIGLLDGTTVYTTKAPLGLDTKKIPESLKKLKYISPKDSTSAGIQVTGILTEDEKNEAKALFSDKGWAKAIDRIGKQPQLIFDDAFLGIFPTKDQQKEAKNILLEVDKPVTAIDKRFYFIQNFLPFLRQQLAHRFIIDTISSVNNLPKNVTNELLSNLLKVENDTAISILEGVKAQSAGGENSWKGYLIPSVDGHYIFSVVSDSETDRPVPLVINDQALDFNPIPQEDLSNGYIWSTRSPKKLKAGNLYELQVNDRSVDQLEWKTATVARTPIPTSALLPNDLEGSGKEGKVFKKLSKIAFVINSFNLSIDEVIYWQNNAVDFDGFDINKITLQHLLRLQAYTKLRHNLPKRETNLLDLFKWAARSIKDDTRKNEELAKLSQKIADVTNWNLKNIDKLLKPEYFDLMHLEKFRDERELIKLQKAIEVADKIAVDIDRLFDWAKPGTKFWACHKIAEDIRNALRARYDQTEWEQVVKPLNDQLRENQKLALISYLLVQPSLMEWGVVDADSLFEFFLIDVQMDACMETSRIKQAISSAQLFVQRCFLGLESKNREDAEGKKIEIGVSNQALSRSRWEWMQRYRVWEANRKVFLYPENWIQPELRDDKSPFYKELESELLQKDINPQTVQDAMKNYLFKVDEVANLKVVGLFLDEENQKLHIFARTRNAPYFFYYRYFDSKQRNWYPWEKVQVDIPNYDVEMDGKIINNGTYLIPVVWNSRLLIFFPQFIKKASPNLSNDDNTFEAIGKSKPSENKPIEYWEIKMAWSEYRNKKWTQKQISTNAIYDSLSRIASYELIPRIVSGGQAEIIIDVYQKIVALGGFHFNGSQIYLGEALVDNTKGKAIARTVFHYVVEAPDEPKKPPLFMIHSLQANGSEIPFLLESEPFFHDKITSVEIHENNTTLNFYHPFVHELLGKLNTGNLNTLFAYYLQRVLDPSDQTKLKDDANETYGESKTPNGKPLYNELKQAYSIYNWEATFHAPMQLVDRLLKSQQFEQALKMCHYIFNPYEKGAGKERFWQFPPFKVVDAESVLEKLFMDLIPNKPDNTPGQQINEWRDNPFQPHVIARSRPSAYMKWVVMKYIEILIAWGDYLFRQDTIETLNQATQIYVLAAHIYGPKGQKIPKRGKIQPQTYNSLVDKWDAFGNAMVELELAFPYSNQTPFPLGNSNGAVGLANVFGFATSLYFCIPDNPKLRGLRDTIDDRLFKIRHCQNIEGVFRKLPLFEPPIDPALLVQAAAQGLSLSSVLNDLNSPVPNYRFYYLLQKALELCSELKSMGNAFLSAKEKGDAEALSKLRAGHESTMQNLLMEVKKQQLEEAGKSLDALQQNRKAPEYRMQHYLGLIGEDADKIPGASADFNALPNQIEKPVDEGGLKLIQYEKDEMDKAAEGKDKQKTIGQIETLAGVLHLLPTITGNVEPLGVGASVSYGGTLLGAAAQATAKYLQIEASDLTYQSSNAGRKAGFLRQLQDRIQQANIAGYEIKNIDKQILTQQIRINIANQEITNQQKNIDNSQEVEEFLRNKYTNEELYTWMEGQIQTLYYQAYTLAYELAKKAEKVFRFERGMTNSNFIQFGYWDAARNGLLAGERLYIGLKQLEAAYQEKRGYDYEITKHISLRQVNPLALMSLKKDGTCEFALPEVLFDMDYPGHYMRRIKSVALTVPCVVGPYTSLNCTFRLVEHKFRISAIASDNNYLEKTEETDDRFSTVNVPIAAIAGSTGQNDSGVFELNFKDERYLPFEGAGAISKWRLELPNKFRQFDYDTISDVVVHIRYTAMEGGDKLKGNAAKSVQDYIKSVEDLSKEEGLFAAFNLKHEFASEWHKAMSSPEADRVIMLSNLHERLPIFAKGRDPKNIIATDLYLFSPTKLTASIGIQGKEDSMVTFTEGDYLSINDPGLSMSDWQLKISEGKLDRLWLVVRYTLS